MPTSRGDLIHTILFLANCDSDVFDDPLTLDFDRQSNKHIAFSAGSHRCLGSHLARHELAVGLHEWHAAIPDYRVANPDAITYTGGVLAMTYLPSNGTPDHRNQARNPGETMTHPFSPTDKPPKRQHPTPQRP